jgi:hypothetical protein
MSKGNITSGNTIEPTGSRKARQFQRNMAGHDFLLDDSGPGQHSTLIFLNITILTVSKCIYWHFNCTFTTTPLLFTRITTMHALKYNNVVPTVFILISECTTRS